MDAVAILRATSALFLVGGLAASLGVAVLLRRRVSHQAVACVGAGAVGYSLGALVGALAAAQWLTFVAPDALFALGRLSVEWLALLLGFGSSVASASCLPLLLRRLRSVSRAQVAVAAVVGCLIAFAASPWVAAPYCGDELDPQFFRHSRCAGPDDNEMQLIESAP
jgi:hypothetical protein